ncbi:MAG TPA: ParB N-terminal domain-containing protein [Bryobacteraceae bacterium]|jgi:hypothetical protein|nr:ParB N-terminal domain-containing protein [Bryobacteraceae bacterium]
MGDRERNIDPQTERWPIDRLCEYARNPRKNDGVVDRMCASIREFGFKIPCLVRSDGEIVDGHLRFKAARKLGIADIPVILCDEWTPGQVQKPSIGIWICVMRSSGSRSSFPFTAGPASHASWTILKLSPSQAEQIVLPHDPVDPLVIHLPAPNRR